MIYYKCNDNGGLTMYLDNLVLEVTRSCNLKCEHCLRGCSERCHFNTSYLSNIFDGIEGLNSITFSGGEPLLKIGTIVKTLDYIREHNISLGSFYIVHNGTIFSKYLMNILKDYYENYVSEKEICGFSLSRDKFHLKQIERLKMRNHYYDYLDLKEYEYGFDFIADDRKEIGSLIEEGRGKRNRNKIVTRYGHRRPYYFNGFLREEDYGYDNCTVYVAANGNVINNCDLSFRTVDKFSFGNIKKTLLIEIIQSNQVSGRDLVRIEL